MRLQLGTSVVVLLVVAVAMLVLPCIGAAANRIQAADPVGDTIYPNVDLTGVVLEYADDGTVSVGIATNQATFYGGDLVYVYFDIDLNANTGWFGADYGVFLDQRLDGRSIVIGRWTGSQWQEVDSSALVYSIAGGALAFSLPTTSIGSPTVGINVFVRGTHRGTNYSADQAPGNSSFGLAFFPSAVGGTHGEGVGPPELPVTTVREARFIAAQGMRASLGKRASIKVGVCKRAASARLRCAVVARRAALTWSGYATVGEIVRDGTQQTSFMFAGKRTSSHCIRRATSAAARRRCVIALRW